MPLPVFLQIPRPPATDGVGAGPSSPLNSWQQHVAPGPGSSNGIRSASFGRQGAGPSLLPHSPAMQRSNSFGAPPGSAPAMSAAAAPFTPGSGGGGGGGGAAPPMHTAHIGYGFADQQAQYAGAQSGYLSPLPVSRNGFAASRSLC